MLTTSFVFEKITEWLKKNRVKYELLEHEPVFTSKQAAKTRGCQLSSGAKALVFSADKKPILIVVPGDKKIETKKFKKEYRIKDLRIITPEELKELTGLEPGAVPPFGNLMGLPTYVDRKLTEKEEIVFNAGAHTKSIKMKAEDYLACCPAMTGDFSI